MLTIGTSSGDDGTDLEFHDMLIALSLNLITQKLIEWNSNIRQYEIPFSNEHIGKITELADNEEQVIRALCSAMKPLSTMAVYSACVMTGARPFLLPSTQPSTVIAA